MSSEQDELFSRQYEEHYGTRPTWDEFFLDLADLWSTMSTCSRRQVGAVVVQDRKVIGNGFNGVASGKVHCLDGGCPRGGMGPEVPPGADYNVYPCYAIHAEHNAILQAGLAECGGATLYITDQPCQQCTNLIEHAKIGRVVVSPQVQASVRVGSPHLREGVGRP